MWIIQRNAVSDEQQDSVQQFENRLRSGGIENSEIVYMDLNFANLLTFLMGGILW